MRNKVLIIEDDQELALVLKDFFEDHALEVFYAPSGEEGLSLYHEEKPDLIILDVLLPGRSGFDVIGAIRDKDIATPIIMMTGTENNEKSKLAGYELGAINYLSKPVNPQVLLAQIKNILCLRKDLVQYKIGGMSIRLHAQHIMLDAKPHQLREKDIQVLRLLLERKNQVVDRSVMLKQIWKNDCLENSNQLDSSMSRIRKIVNKYPAIAVKTIYGTGYMLTEKV